MPALPQSSTEDLRREIEALRQALAAREDKITDLTERLRKHDAQIAPTPLPAPELTKCGQQPPGITSASSACVHAVGHSGAHLAGSAHGYVWVNPPALNPRTSSMS
jgi:hypothetical protein